jgi:hypothetical protein
VCLTSFVSVCIREDSFDWVGVAYLRGSGSVLAKAHTYIGLCDMAGFWHGILIFGYDSIYML